MGSLSLPIFISQTSRVSVFRPKEWQFLYRGSFFIYFVTHLFQPTGLGAWQHPIKKSPPVFPVLAPSPPRACQSHGIQVVPSAIPIAFHCIDRFLIGQFQNSRAQGPCTDKSTTHTGLQNKGKKSGPGWRPRKVVRREQKALLDAAPFPLHSCLAPRQGWFNLDKVVTRLLAEDGVGH